MLDTHTPFRNFPLEAFVSTIHCGKVALWSWDPKSETAYLDSLAMEFWGVGRSRVPMEQLWQRIPEDQREKTIAAWRASANAKGPYEFIFQIDRPDAPPIWVEARGVGGAQGETNGEILATFLDRTKEENTRITQQTLIREMGHRISNLFSVTGGVLQLARHKHDTVSEFAKDLSQRFAQLSNAYRAIMRSPDSANGRTSMTEALTALLTPYGISDTQLTMDFDPTPQIDDTLVTSLALIMHELITNALKYGALASEGGRLAVSLKQCDAGYALTWTETGTHISVDNHAISTGFGERLIQQTAQMAFGAEIARSYPDGGLRLEMVIPIEKFAGKTPYIPA